MKAVLIGSSVFSEDYQDVDLLVDEPFVEKWAEKFPIIESVDSPLARTYVSKIESMPVELRVPNKGTAHDRVLQLESQITDIQKVFGFSVPRARLEVLAALKKAHLIHPHRWERHIRKYLELKEKLGVREFNIRIQSSDIQEIFKLHRKEIKNFAKPHPKLNVSKDSFFEEAEFKIFDHDSIHRAVALGPQPAYTLMQDGEVWCSKEKWLAMAAEDKLRCVIEEASVLALERSIIPALYLKKTYCGAQWAYEFALSKICTTITSGWFRDFSIENYIEAVKRRPDFCAKFFDGIKNKTVKVLKPELVFGATRG